MGIFRMYTGADGKSVIEELRLDDPILETLKTCTGCSLQVNAPSEFSDFHPAPRRRWMTMISGQIDIQLADGTIYSFGPDDLRLWEDVTGEGHRTRFPVPSVSISMTTSTVVMKRAVPVRSALALNTLSPVPTIGRPSSSVG